MNGSVNNKFPNEKEFSGENYEKKGSEFDSSGENNFNRIILEKVRIKNDDEVTVEDEVTNQDIKLEVDEGVLEASHSVNQSLGILDNEEVLNTLEELRSYSDDLNDVCVVKCALCQREITRQSKYSHNKSHVGEKPDYYFTVLKFHSCKICGESLPFCGTYMESHLVWKHADLGITWLVYKEQYLHTKQSPTLKKRKISAVAECKVLAKKQAKIKKNKDKTYKCSKKSKRKMKGSDNDYDDDDDDNDDDDDDVYEPEYSRTSSEPNIPDCQQKFRLKQVHEKHRVYSDDLSDVCLVKCNICDLEIKRRDKCQHNKEHREKPSYRFTKLRFHRCRICDSSLPFCATNIGTHMREKHADLGMTWNFYKATHLMEKNSNTSFKEEPSECDYKYKSEVKKGKSFPENFDLKNMPEEMRTYSDDLGDVCLLKCTICGEELERKNRFYHNKLHRGMKLEYYYARLTFHRCKVCHASLPFCATNIGTHVREMHPDVGLNWNTYAAVHLNGKKSKIPQLKVEKADNDGSEGAGQHILENDKVKLIPEEQRTYSDDLADVCLLKCNICGEELHRNNKFYHNKLHRGNKPEYYFSRLTFHRCKICGYGLPFCGSHLEYHLSSKHAEDDLTWHSYRTKYLENSQTPIRKYRKRGEVFSARESQEIDEQSIKEEFLKTEAEDTKEPDNDDSFLPDETGSENMSAGKTSSC